MKKKSSLIGLCFGACLALLSCDLDYAPENTLVDEKVYKDEGTAEAALMGAYVRLNVFLAGAPQDQNNYANTGYMFQLADVGTENLAVRNTAADYLAVETGEYSSAVHDGMLYNLWHWCYNAVDMANNVISGIQRFGDYDPAMEAQHIAEAKFIRAYCYFAMLCAFGDQALLGNDEGQGIVLRLDPYNGYNPEEVEGRSTNAECWNRIITDLTEAIPDLPEAVPAAAERIRANRAVAQALLSRVYLYKGTYTNNAEELTAARDYAADVLAVSGYTFATSSTEFSTALFPSNEYSQTSSYPDPTTRSGELLFFEPSRLYTDNYPNGMYYYEKRSYYVPQERLSLYDADDVRRTYLLRTGSRSSNPNDSTCMKYSGGQYDDVIFIRLAEVKLTYAETLVRVGGVVTQEAVDQLNDIHQRAYPDGLKPAVYTLADFSSTGDFLRTLLTERNRELAYEGHYRWDLMRTGNFLGDTKLGAVDKARWNLPVPDYEIRISEGVISQNSGYNQ